MDKLSQQEWIKEYYRNSEISYVEGWDLKKSMSLHGGYWDKKATTFRKALGRLNEVMAAKAEVKKSDYVLDAGCGVGGSSIFLGKQYGCKVLGITLLQEQVKTATDNALRHNVSHLVTFEVRDFTDTGLMSSSFDVIYAIESVCHAMVKEDFIREAHRLLKPGGRLILTDYFNGLPATSSNDIVKYDWFLKSFAVTSLDSVDYFLNTLQKHNFQNIEAVDNTPFYLPNLKRLYWLGTASVFLTRVLKSIGIKRKNTTKVAGGYAALLSRYFVKNGIMKWVLFYAQKPN